MHFDLWYFHLMRALLSYNPTVSWGKFVPPISPSLLPYSLVWHGLSTLGSTDKTFTQILFIWSESSFIFSLILKYVSILRIILHWKFFLCQHLKDITLLFSGLLVLIWNPVHCYIGCVFFLYFKDLFLSLGLEKIHQDLSFLAFCLF